MRIYLYVYILCILFPFCTPFLRISSLGRQSSQSLTSSLDPSNDKGLRLIELKIPVQEDTKKYLDYLIQNVPREKIVRWYISRIDKDDSKAVVEVVVMN